MIGRNAEIALLSGMIAESRAGRGNAVAVFGEAGIGKSALLAEVVRTSADDDLLVLRATGIEAEAELPFAALHLLLRPARHLVDRLPGAQRTALRGAFGEGAPPAAGQEDGPDRFLVGLAVLTLLADLAEERPLLCLVDDVQWLDQASVDALLFAARRLAAERITMFFAGRQGPEPAVHGLPEVRPSGQAEVRLSGLPEVRLSGLTKDDCERLLAERATDLAPQARDRVIEEAEGNPLALLQFAGLLTPEQRAGHLAPLPPLPPGSSLAGRLEQSLRAAIRRLPERTRLLLLVAAADGSGSLRLVLTAARALGAGPEDLEPGEHAALVEVSDGWLRFAHPLIKAAAYHEAPLVRRVAAHRALAGVLDGDEHADRRAWHLSAAALEPDEDLSLVMAATGERARSRGSNSAAATAYERAAQLTVARERRAHWLAAAAETALGAGQLPRAGRAAERGRRLTADPALQARLAGVYAAVQAEQGDPALAAHTLIAAATAVTEIAPADAVSLLASAAAAAWFAGDLAALDRSADLMEPLDADVAPHLAPLVSAVRGMRHVAAGDPATGLPLLHAALPPPDTAEPAWLAPEAGAPASPTPGAGESVLPAPGAAEFGWGNGVAGVYAVFSALMTGADDAACALAAARVDACRRQGLVGALPHALQLLTQAQILHGRHAEAAESGAEAWRIARDTGQAGRLRHLNGILAFLAAIRGEDDECRRLAHDAEGGAGERNGSGWGGVALTLLDLVRGRYDAVAERMAHILDGPLGHTVIVTFAIPDYVEACVRMNEPARAAAAFARFDAWAAASGRPWAMAVAHRCRALLAGRADATSNAATHAATNATTNAATDATSNATADANAATHAATNADANAATHAATNADVAADAEAYYVAALGLHSRPSASPSGSTAPRSTFGEPHDRPEADRQGRPFEQARTHLAYGEWLRRARRRADAGVQLRAAVAGFAALGATPWAERARAELAATGARTPASAPRGATPALDTLTPQELQVVRLAATGATNRQIGARLFLSPRTVGFHLYKAYPKLGVSSRADLAGLDLDLGPPA
ncbi:AAA family ATPase [Nonomuraea sp. NN258]|uniref:helix-turn-helix transcriptional regulator n=1 Tax=Nonomuraea antri TaxID=2730852 RepID=UPI001C2C4AE2|nr:LuxR family transcriptional regulator [Nonomuraea antri]NRQ32386.1 AAA family ATPase [Nonomuraea antri]